MSATVHTKTWPTYTPEQTRVTHPFHPLETPPPLRSRSKLHEHFTAPPPVARTLNRKPVDVTIHETADPEGGRRPDATPG
ncbi:hypothetical protein [Micromonospora zamorensis]|uniref:hypothetical protein n=1 Tax=Micromonospora zamorensis TaxID=709883 RepID=UPI00340DA2D9